MIYLVATVCLAGAQQTAIPRKTNPSKVAADPRPVTCEEASHVFTKTRSIMGKLLNVSLGDSSIAAGSKPVTREQIVSEMAAITKSLEPKIKFTPHPQGYSTKVFTIQRDQSDNLKMLVKWGYVGRVSPLATSPQDTMNINQFGDALGFYVARTTELTHMPSIKWSPNLSQN